MKRYVKLFESWINEAVEPNMDITSMTRDQFTELSKDDKEMVLDAVLKSFQEKGILDKGLKWDVTAWDDKASFQFLGTEYFTPVFTIDGRGTEPLLQSMFVAKQQGGPDRLPGSWFLMFMYYATKDKKPLDLKSIAMKVRDVRERNPDAWEEVTSGNLNHKENAEVKTLLPKVTAEAQNILKKDYEEATAKKSVAKEA